MIVAALVVECDVPPWHCYLRLIDDILLKQGLIAIGHPHDHPLTQGYYGSLDLCQKLLIRQHLSEEALWSRLKEYIEALSG